MIILMLITQYKIVSKDSKWVYNGHTKNYKKRVSYHKCGCYNINDTNYDFKLYQIIRENGNIDNFEFIVLEEHYVEDRKEAFIRERYWFDILQPNMNSIPPFRTLEEKREYYKKYNKEYKPTEKRKEAKKIFNNQKITCECGAVISKMNLARHRLSTKHLKFNTPA